MMRALTHKFTGRSIAAGLYLLLVFCSAHLGACEFEFLGHAGGELTHVKGAGSEIADRRGDLGLVGRTAHLRDSVEVWDGDRLDLGMPTLTASDSTPFMPSDALLVPLTVASGEAFSAQSGRSVDRWLRTVILLI